MTLHAAVFVLAASCVVTVVNAASDEEINRGREVYKKSNCAFCHGWAGDGRGHPRSPGAAPSLRVTQLDAEAIETIIRCGVPGGSMPYHDRTAWREGRCGVGADAVSGDFVPQKGIPIRDRDWEALLAYLKFGLQGAGQPGMAECERYFRPGSRNCRYLEN